MSDFGSDPKSDIVVGGVDRGAIARWWPAVWAATSAVLLLVSVQVESGGFVAAAYLVLNAATVLYVRLGTSSFRDRSMTITGWCAAAQLPVMLWLVSNSRRDTERQHAYELLADSRRSTTGSAPES